MKTTVSWILFLFATSAFAGSGTCARPATLDAFPDQWENAADQFYTRFEKLQAEDIPSHVQIHGAIKQLAVFNLNRLLKKNGCDVAWVRTVIKTKTKALKASLIHSDLADLPENEKASARQRYNYRIALAKSLSSTDTYQAYSTYYITKDNAYQGRAPDSVRKAADKAGRAALKVEMKQLKADYAATLKEIKAKYKTELAEEKIQEKATRKTK